MCSLSLQKIALALIPLFFVACSSAPQVSTRAFTEKEASAWLQQYCSKLPEQRMAHTPSVLGGELVLRASTKEISGVYPVTIRFTSAQEFTFELTSVLGGTLARMHGLGDNLDLVIPPKPRLNRHHIQTYMGLPVPVLMQLFHGDMPCPDLVDGKRAIVVSKGEIVLESSQWRWAFERAENGEPALVKLTSISGNVQITFSIEDWDHSSGYAKKVELISPEGKLKWTWRNRQLQ
jgi:hypothetical protein